MLVFTWQNSEIRLRLRHLQHAWLVIGTTYLLAG